MIPFISPYWAFQTSAAIHKGDQVRPVYFSIALVSTAPINLKPKDVLTIDIRNGKVESIERRGITIWRDAWRN